MKLFFLIAAILFTYSYIEAIPIGIAKKIDHIDSSEFRDLPFNFIGTINHGTYNLLYDSIPIIGELDQILLGKHLQYRMVVMGDSLMGKIRHRHRFNLKLGDIQIKGKTTDLRPPTWKADGRLPLYAHKFALKIGNSPFEGLITQDAKKDLTVDLKLGPSKISGKIFLANRYGYYDLRIGAKLIKGYRDFKSTEIKLYASKLSKIEILALLLIDILLRDARFVPGFGLMFTPG